MKQKKTVDVIIPVYQPDDRVFLLLRRLWQQTILPEHIIILYTLVEGEEEAQARERFSGDGVIFLPVKKSEFDHGATRNIGAKQSQADYLLFMTQDAMPADIHLIESLLEGFRLDGSAVGICYGRQFPRKGADFVERMTRLYNYPDKSRLQNHESVKTLGIKAYFCSDVCAMYDRDIYEQLGGFVSPTVFNEDMIMASKVIDAGYSVYYAAQAKVIHSHSYTCMQQFRRNFDLGVSQRQYREVFDRVSSEKEGVGFTKKILFTLWKRRQFMAAVYFLVQCVFRFVGYQMGKHYKRLPHTLLMKCTASKDYVLFRQ